MMADKSTAELVLDTLNSYGLKSEGNGQYRSNRPWSLDSDSMGLTVTITDGEHGAYTDHVTGKHGSLYELADDLGIPISGNALFSCSCTPYVHLG